MIITERVAVAAFIAGYTDPTRRSYATDLRIFSGWCHESRTLGLDRNELGALLAQAGRGDLRDGALITLLALNGLRISEALNTDIEDLSTERGHRTLVIVRKAGKHVTIDIATHRPSTRSVHR